MSNDNLIQCDAVVSAKRNLLEHLEYWSVSLFPLIFGLLILPSKNIYNVFIGTRVTFLELFIFIIGLMRLFSAKDSSLRDLLQGLGKQPKYIYILMIIIFVFILSHMFSVYKPESLFGVTQLRTGLLFYVLCACLFWIFSTVKHFSIKPTILLAIILSIISISEFLGFRPLVMITEMYSKLPDTYPMATVGVRGQLAGLMLILSFVVLVYSNKITNNYIRFSILLLSFMGLGVMSNSSAIIATIIGCFLFIFFYIKQLGFKIISLVLPIIIGMLSVFYLKPINNYLMSLGYINKTTSVKDISNSTTIKTRILLWKAAINMTQAHPIFGWGFQQYDDNWFNYLGNAEKVRLMSLELGIPRGTTVSLVGDSIAWIDKNKILNKARVQYVSAHSTFFDLLYQTGVMGVFFSLLFLISLFQYILKFYPKRVIYFLPFVVYGIYLMAWFITVPTFGITCALMGTLMANLRKDKFILGG